MSPDLFEAALEPTSTAALGLLRLKTNIATRLGDTDEQVGALPLDQEHALRDLLNRRHDEREHAEWLKAGGVP